MTAFWFQPESPLNLGVCRLLWFGFLFCFYAETDFSGWGDVDGVFWVPISLYQRFNRPPFSRESLAVLQMIWRVSLLLSCVGLWTRASTAIAASLGTILLGLPHCFGKVNHSDAVVPLTMLILACARCGDAVSVDRGIAVTLGNSAPVPSSGEYRWPVRAVWVLVALIFLAAGVAKLRTGGLAWANGDSLSIYLVSHQYSHHDQVWSRLGLVVAQHHWLCVALSIATLVLECGLFPALFHNGTRGLFAGASATLLIGIPLLMGPFFPPLLATFLFWIPWDKVSGAIGRFAARTNPAIGYESGVPVITRRIAAQVREFAEEWAGDSPRAGGVTRFDAVRARNSPRILSPPSSEPAKNCSGQGDADRI
jgi:hypothetical protein